LYIVATLVGFTVREVIPWWLTAGLLLRELVLGVALVILRRHGYGPPPVHYLGKTGTFVLLAAFPVLLLADAVPAWSPVASPVGWGLAWWGLGLYWAAAVLYLAQTAALLRADRAAGPGPTPPPGGPPGGRPVGGPPGGGLPAGGPRAGDPPGGGAQSIGPPMAGPPPGGRPGGLPGGASAVAG
jgi:hypothetical protein